MPNPSERGIADLATATDAELQEYAHSPDKLLGCAVRDEIKRRKLAAEQGTPGPASPELCEALGINADDLKDALPVAHTPIPRTPKPHYIDRQGGGGKLHPSWEQKADEAMLKKAAESLAGESVKTKEAVVTTVATYLANKADNWWMQPASFREKEMFFVIKMLVHTYSSLEET
jgi:hypothetical protein